MQDYLTDRLRGARWYIGRSDGLNAIIYDASDLEGDGPNGHGMVCDAIQEDAVLIAASPDLLRVAKTLLAVLESVDFSPLTDGTYDQIPWAALEQAIAKAEGRSTHDCATGNHKCYDDDQTCGCWCKGCIDLTEPRCPRCNSILEKGVCPDYQDCVPLTEGREE